MTEKEKDEAFEYVLDKIARNALQKIHMNPDDERYAFVVRLVLINFSEMNTDEDVLRIVQKHMEYHSIQLPEAEVLDIIRNTRANCDRQRFAVEQALDQIENNLSGEEVYNNLSGFLSRSI